MLIQTHVLSGVSMWRPRDSLGEPRAAQTVLRSKKKKERRDVVRAEELHISCSMDPLARWSRSEQKTLEDDDSDAVESLHLQRTG